MAYQNILYEKKDRVAKVTLNRPEYLNALVSGMMEALADVFQEMERDEEVLATIITGAGRAFCAGAFMKDPDAHTVNNSAEWVNQPVGVSPIWAYPKPLIGAINGPAYGGGLNMVLACDFIIASTEARFCFPMARLGFIPSSPGVQALALWVGKAKAAEIAMLARPVTGEDAYRCGLANKVVAADQLMDEATSWALEVAALAPLSTRLIKEDLRESLDHHLDFKANRLRSMAARLSSDMEEGHRAWREKRAPVFTGR